MKRMKKILAILLTLAMILGMSVTAFATGETAGDKAKVIGIEQEDGVTISVNAYKIISYNNAGYYEEILPNTIESVSISGATHPQLKPDNAENIQKLFIKKNELGEPVKFVLNEENGNYESSELTAGTWMVVVEGSQKYLYNPMIISVSQGTEDLVYGQLNVKTDSWMVGETELFAKRNEPKISKTAESAKTQEGGTDNGNYGVTGVQYDDILKFTVSADIPSYMTNKTGIKYVIRDTLTGLELVSGGDYAPTATVGGVSNNELTVAVENAIQDKATSFEVEGLSSEFLTANRAKKIVIVYYARVISKTLTNVDELNNTAQLEYSTNVDGETVSKNAETKHYTFGIDTKISGNRGTSTSENTGEFIKINEHGDVSYNKTVGTVTKTEGETEYLSGAVFELRIGISDNNAPKFKDKTGKKEFTTDKDGRLQIVGLDDDKQYYLVEIKAPKGYTPNETPVPVSINATYEGDKLTAYEVIIGGRITYYEYDMSPDGSKTTLKNDEGHPSNPYGFKNTKLAALPSTGGIGTTIFTIGGCIIMIIAAGLFFASRRKKAEN